jgi:hypothetical protein
VLATPTSGGERCTFSPRWVATPPGSVDVVQVASQHTVRLTTASAANAGIIVIDAAATSDRPATRNHWSDGDADALQAEHQRHRSGDGKTHATVVPEPRAAAVKRGSQIAILHVDGG